MRKKSHQQVFKNKYAPNKLLEYIGNKIARVTFLATTRIIITNEYAPWDPASLSYRWGKKIFLVAKIFYKANKKLVIMFVKKVSIIIIIENILFY